MRLPNNGGDRAPTLHLSWLNEAFSTRNGLHLMSYWLKLSMGTHKWLRQLTALYKLVVRPCCWEPHFHTSLNMENWSRCPEPSPRVLVVFMYQKERYPRKRVNTLQLQTLSSTVVTYLRDTPQYWHKACGSHHQGLIGIKSTPWDRKPYPRLLRWPRPWDFDRAWRSGNTKQYRSVKAVVLSLWVVTPSEACVECFFPSGCLKPPENIFTL